MNLKSEFSILTAKVDDIKFKLRMHLEITMELNIWISSRELDTFWFNSVLGETFSLICLIWVQFFIAFLHFEWECNDNVISNWANQTKSLTWFTFKSTTINLTHVNPKFQSLNFIAVALKWFSVSSWYQITCRKYLKKQ